MKVLILGGEGEFSNAVINSFSECPYEVEVVLEKHVSKLLLLKRRIKKLGLKTVIGQILFSCLIVPLLRKKSQYRIEEILNKYNMNTDDHYRGSVKIHNVESINNVEAIRYITDSQPDIVVVNGTRIISKEVLDHIVVPIINLHTGITPKYRGVHGGYWALANNDIDNFGVTVHFVNTGIDTGEIIRQKRLNISKEDNFVTYPYIQVCEGIILEKEIVDEYFGQGTIKTITSDLSSCIWSHPTFIQYLKSRRRGIR